MRFPIARGVSVLVKVDLKSKMSIVQALEAALAEARTRSDLAPLATRTIVAEAMPEKPKKKNDPKLATRPDFGEPDIAVFRRKLRSLAETIAAKNSLSNVWRKKYFGSWLRRLSVVQGPSNFTRLMIELELNVTDANRDLGPSKSRRRVWRNECSTAKTFKAAGKLLTELGELFQVGRV